MSEKSGRKKIPVIIIDKQGKVRKSKLYVPVLDPYSDPSLEDGDVVKPKRSWIKHEKKASTV